MRVLLTNDDGVHAPGLSALVEAFQGIAEVIVVAPAREHSGCGHGVTVDTPLEIQSCGPGKFAVTGTPVDCVRVGLAYLAKDAAYVVSGINTGANLGTDVWQSGTVAAAREAALRGLTGIAISQCYRSIATIDWARATTLARTVVRDLTNQPLLAAALWNVNLPWAVSDSADPTVAHCHLDGEPPPLTYRRNGQTLQFVSVFDGRPHRSGTDVALCFAGKLTISRVL